MRIGVLLLVSLGMVAGLSRADSPKKLTDAEISKLLVGKWAADEGNDKVKIKGTTTYRKDGSTEGEATVEAGYNKVKIAISGTWKVMDGVIIATVTKTSNSRLIPEGLVTKDKVISIDEKAFRYKTEKGKETTRQRITESEKK